MESECLLNCESLLIVKSEYFLNLDIVMKKKLSAASASFKKIYLFWHATRKGEVGKCRQSFLKKRAKKNRNFGKYYPV